MSIRTERIAKLIQREVAEILNADFSEQLHPMVTVTGARITKDLSIAYVYVSIMATTAQQRQSSFKHLEDLTPQVRTHLAGRIRHQVRVIPELKFFLDESIEQAQHLEDLFDRIRAERSRREAE